MRTRRPARRSCARVLADTLKRQFVHGTTHAVFGVLKDKDIAGIVRAMQPVVD